MAWNPDLEDLYKERITLMQKYAKTRSDFEKSKDDVVLKYWVEFYKKELERNKQLIQLERTPA